MDYDNQIKQLLVEVDSDKFNSDESLPFLSRDKLKKLIKVCEEEGFLSHTSSKGQPLLLGFMGGDFDLHPSAFVTRSGKKFIEGIDRSENVSHQINIGTVHGSNIGNYNTVNNYLSENPIGDLKKFISELEDSADKAEAYELVKTLESEEIKPGLLKRFDTLIGKYDNIAKLVGTIATTALIQLNK